MGDSMTKTKESVGATMSIYVTDVGLYNQLQDELKALWFSKYGESLTKSEILVKSMLHLKSFLVGNIPIEKSSFKKDVSNYCRFNR